MSSPDHPTSNIEDAFSSNFPDYIPAVPNYFPASPGNTYSNSSEDSRDGIIPAFSPFYNNPYIKEIQAFYAKELSIPSPTPITPLTVLTPSLVLPPSLLFDPRYFFVTEELLPPKKQTCLPSLSSTDLSNPSWKQACNLTSPSFSVYTPTPPQIFELWKGSIKMHLKHHEKQIEDILNYLDELSFHHIEKMDGRTIVPRDLDESKIKLGNTRAQISKLQKKRLGQKDKIAFAHFRISNLEQIIEEIQARHQADQEDLQDAIYKLKINNEGPSDN
ncbi:hypothetical protein Tco_1436505 [Tanacetum coccineum]